MNVLPTAPFTASMPRITEDHAPSAPVDVLRTRYSAVIFDMDGVVTDTASVHARAWQQLFDAILLDERLQPAEPGGQIDRSAFDVLGEYRTYVDGRRREDGVRALLAARGAMLPEARNADEPQAGDWTVQGQAATKDGFFHAELKEHGVRVFPRTVKLIERLQTAGVPVGLVTASRNALASLTAAGLDRGPLRELHLLTAKPFLYVFNLDEDELTDDALRSELSALVAPAEAVFLDAKVEAGEVVCIIGPSGDCRFSYA